MVVETLSMVAMICVSLSMLVVMNLGCDSPQPEEEEVMDTKVRHTNPIASSST